MNEHLKWMRMAIAEEKKSSSEKRSDPAPKVGAVLVKDGQLLGTAYRGQSGSGNHAEFGLIESLKGADLIGSTLYTTLEPCSRRNHPKKPCACWVIESGIKEVFIGIYDPNPKIFRDGWRLLRDAGISLRDFPEELRSEIRDDNRDFLAQYKGSLPDERNYGRIKFDYTLSGGKYSLGSEDSKIETQWTTAGAGVIHAVNQRDHVVLARHAREFSEIDDPSALWEFSHYTVTVGEGEIVIFRNKNGFFALVKILKVLAGPERGSDRFELEAEYEMRSPAERLDKK